MASQRGLTLVHTRYIYSSTTRVEPEAISAHVHWCKTGTLTVVLHVHKLCSTIFYNRIGDGEHEQSHYGEHARHDLLSHNYATAASWNKGTTQHCLVRSCRQLTAANSKGLAAPRVAEHLRRYRLCF